MTAMRAITWTNDPSDLRDGTLYAVLLADSHDGMAQQLAIADGAQCRKILAESERPWLLTFIPQDGNR